MHKESIALYPKGRISNDESAIEARQHPVWLRFMGMILNVLPTQESLQDDAKENHRCTAGSVQSDALDLLQGNPSGEEHCARLPTRGDREVRQDSQARDALVLDGRDEPDISFFAGQVVRTLGRNSQFQVELLLVRALQEGPSQRNRIEELDKGNTNPVVAGHGFTLSELEIKK